MQVLLVTGSYPPMKCGVGDYTSHLAAALAVLPDVEVSVLTTQSGEVGDSTVDGVDVRRALKSWRAGEWRTVYRKIKELRPDVVHVQYPTQGYGNGFLPFMVPLMAKMLGSKVVQTWHEGCSIRRLPHLFLQAIVPGGLVAVRPNYRKMIWPIFRWALWNKTFRFIGNAAIVPRAMLSEAERNALRERYLQGQRRMVVFFGFVLPAKGVELLFDVADPATDQLVIAGELIDPGTEQNIRRRQSEPAWHGRSTLTGFLMVEDAAALLAVADAVVLPFRKGGGEWNSSIHAAAVQGTFVLTTSKTVKGYDAETNVYFARIDDVKEMKAALQAHAGTRQAQSSEPYDWAEIARDHKLLYQAVGAA